MYDVSLSVGIANLQDLRNQIKKALSDKGITEFAAPKTRTFLQPLGRIRGELGEFEKSLEASNARVIAFGMSAGAIYGVTSALKATVVAAVEVEKTLANIAIMMGRSLSSLKTFGNELFGIAGQMGTSFNEAAKAALEFSRQGLSMQETLKRTKDALLLTRISGMDAADAVSSITAAINSFGRSALDSTRLVNQMAAVDMKFAVSSADLAEAIKRVGSTASEAGLSIEQLMALVTAAQQTTQRGGAVIGNAFKSIFTRLETPGVINALEGVGVKVKDMQGVMRPTMDILQDLAKRFDNLGAAEQSHVSRLIGGIYQINILKSSLRDLGKSFSFYEQALQTASNATDEAQQRSEELNQTLSARLNKTVVNLTQMGSQIGGLSFSPAIKKLLNSLEDVTSLQFGSGLGSAIFSGIGKILSGPAVSMVTLVIMQLAKKMVFFVNDALRQVAGLDRERKNAANIEQQVAFWLNREKELMFGLLTGAVSLNDVQSRFINFLRQETVLMSALQLGAKDLSQSMSRMGAIGGIMGFPFGIKLPPTTTSQAPPIGRTPRNIMATGFVPEEAEKISALASGYKPGAVKRTVLEGKPIIYNTAEQIVPVNKVIPWAKGNSAFIIPPAGSDARRKYDIRLESKGIDPRTFYGRGFIPNLADEPAQKNIRMLRFPEEATLSEFAKKPNIRYFAAEPRSYVVPRFLGKRYHLHGLTPEKAALFAAVAKQRYEQMVNEITFQIFGVQNLKPFSISPGSTSFGPIKGHIFNDVMNTALVIPSTLASKDVLAGTKTENEAAVLKAFSGTELLKPGIIGEEGAEFKISKRAVRAGIRGGQAEASPMQELYQQKKGIKWVGPGNIGNERKAIGTELYPKHRRQFERLKGPVVYSYILREHLLRKKGYSVSTLPANLKNLPPLLDETLPENQEKLNNILGVEKPALKASGFIPNLALAENSVLRHYYKKAKKAARNNYKNWRGYAFWDTGPMGKYNQNPLLMRGTRSAEINTLLQQGQFQSYWKGANNEQLTWASGSVSPAELFAGRHQRNWLVANRADDAVLQQGKPYVVGLTQQLFREGNVGWAGQGESGVNVGLKAPIKDSDVRALFRFNQKNRLTPMSLRQIHAIANAQSNASSGFVPNLARLKNITMFRNVFKRDTLEYDPFSSPRRKSSSALGYFDPNSRRVAISTIVDKLARPDQKFNPNFAHEEFGHYMFQTLSRTKGFQQKLQALKQQRGIYNLDEIGRIDKANPYQQKPFQMLVKEAGNTLKDLGYDTRRMVNQDIIDESFAWNVASHFGGLKLDALAGLTNSLISPSFIRHIRRFQQKEGFDKVKKNISTRVLPNIEELQKFMPPIESFAKGSIPNLARQNTRADYFLNMWRGKQFPNIRHSVLALRGETGSVYLANLESFAPGQGLGSNFMRQLSSTADKARVKVSLIPSASGAENTLNQEQLVNFYQKFGFKFNKDGDSMTRLPKKAGAGYVPNLAYVPLLTPAVGRILTNLVNPRGYTLSEKLSILGDASYKEIFKSILLNKPIYEANSGPSLIRQFAWKSMFVRKPKVPENLKEEITQTGPRTFAFNKGTQNLSDIIGSASLNKPWNLQENIGSRAQFFHPVMAGFDMMADLTKNQLSYHDKWDIALHEGEPTYSMKSLAKIGKNLLKSTFATSIYGVNIAKAGLKRRNWQAVKDGLLSIGDGLKPRMLKQGFKYGWQEIQDENIIGSSGDSLYGQTLLANTLRKGVNAISNPITFAGTINFPSESKMEKIVMAKQKLASQNKWNVVNRLERLMQSDVRLNSTKKVLLQLFEQQQRPEKYISRGFIPNLASIPRSQLRSLLSSSKFANITYQKQSGEIGSYRVQAGGPQGVRRDKIKGQQPPYPFKTWEDFYKERGIINLYSNKAGESEQSATFRSFLESNIKQVRAGGEVYDILARGFIPNLASIGAKRPIKFWKAKHSTNVRSIEYADTGSFMDYNLRSSSRSIFLENMQSKNKGDAFRLFGALLRTSRRTGRPIVSDSIISQMNPRHFDAKSNSNWDNLIGFFPQLRYRDREGVNTSGRFSLQAVFPGDRLEFEFSNLKEIANKISHIDKTKFLRMLEGDSIEITNLKTRYINQAKAAGLIPNLANQIQKIFSKGFVPNLSLFSKSVQTPQVMDAVRREVSAGYSPSQVKIGYDRRIGPLVYNTTEGSAQNAVNLHLNSGKNISKIKKLGSNYSKGLIPNLAEGEGAWPEIGMGLGMFASQLMMMGMMGDKSGGYQQKKLNALNTQIEIIKKETNEIRAGEITARETNILAEKRKDLIRLQQEYVATNNRIERHRTTQNLALKTSFIAPMLGGMVESMIPGKGGKTFAALADAASLASLALYAIPGPWGVAAAAGTMIASAGSKIYKIFTDVAPELETKLAQSKENFELANNAISNFAQSFDRLQSAFKNNKLSSDIVIKAQNEYAAALADVPEEYRAQVATASSAEDVQKIVGEALMKQAKGIAQTSTADYVRKLINTSNGLVYDTSLFGYNATDKEKISKTKTLSSRIMSSSFEPQKFAARLAQSNLSTPEGWKALSQAALENKEINEDLADIFDHLSKRAAEASGPVDDASKDIQKLGETMVRAAQDMVKYNKSIIEAQPVIQQNALEITRLKRKMEDADSSISKFTDSIYQLASRGVMFGKARQTLTDATVANARNNRISITENAVRQLGSVISDSMRGRIEDSMAMARVQVEGGGKLQQINTKAFADMFSAVDNAIKKTKEAAEKGPEAGGIDTAQENQAINALINLGELLNRNMGASPEKISNDLNTFARQNPEILANKMGDVQNEITKIIEELIISRASIGQEMASQIELQKENNRINAEARTIARNQRVLGGAEGFFNPGAFKESALKTLKGTAILTQRNSELFKGSGALTLLEGLQGMGLLDEGVGEKGASLLKEMAIQARGKEIFNEAQGVGNFLISKSFSTPKTSVERASLFDIGMGVKRNFTLDKALNIAGTQINTAVPMSKLPVLMQKEVENTSQMLNFFSLEFPRLIQQSNAANKAIFSSDSSENKKGIEAFQNIRKTFETLKSLTEKEKDFTERTSRLQIAQQQEPGSEKLIKELNTIRVNEGILGVTRKLASSTQNPGIKAQAEALAQEIEKLDLEKSANAAEGILNYSRKSSDILLDTYNMFRNPNTAYVHITNPDEIGAEVVKGIINIGSVTNVKNPVVATTTAKQTQQQTQQQTQSTTPPTTPPATPPTPPQKLKPRSPTEKPPMTKAEAQQIIENVNQIDYATPYQPFDTYSLLNELKSLGLATYSKDEKKYIDANKEIGQFREAYRSYLEESNKEASKDRENENVVKNYNATTFNADDFKSNIEEQKQMLKKRGEKARELQRALDSVKNTKEYKEAIAKRDANKTPQTSAAQTAQATEEAAKKAKQAEEEARRSGQSSQSSQPASQGTGAQASTTTANATDSATKQKLPWWLALLGGAAATGYLAYSQESRAKVSARGKWAFQNATASVSNAANATYRAITGKRMFPTKEAKSYEEILAETEPKQKFTLKNLAYWKYNRGINQKISAQQDRIGKLNQEYEALRTTSKLSPEEFDDLVNGKQRLTPEQGGRLGMSESIIEGQDIKAQIAKSEERIVNLQKRIKKAKISNLKASQPTQSLKQQISPKTPNQTVVDEMGGIVEKIRQQKIGEARSQLSKLDKELENWQKEYDDVATKEGELLKKAEDTKIKQEEALRKNRPAEAKLLGNLEKDYRKQASSYGPRFRELQSLNEEIFARRNKVSEEISQLENRPSPINKPLESKPSQPVSARSPKQAIATLEKEIEKLKRQKEQINQSQPAKYIEDSKLGDELSELERELEDVKTIQGQDPSDEYTKEIKRINAKIEETKSKLRELDYRGYAQRAAVAEGDINEKMDDLINQRQKLIDEALRPSVLEERTSTPLKQPKPSRILSLKNSLKGNVTSGSVPALVAGLAAGYIAPKFLPEDWLYEETTTKGQSQRLGAGITSGLAGQTVAVGAEALLKSKKGAGSFKDLVKSGAGSLFKPQTLSGGAKFGLRSVPFFGGVLGGAMAGTTSGLAGEGAGMALSKGIGAFVGGVAMPIPILNVGTSLLGEKAAELYYTLWETRKKRAELKSFDPRVSNKDKTKSREVLEKISQARTAVRAGGGIKFSHLFSEEAKENSAKRTLTAEDYGGKEEFEKLVKDISDLFVENQYFIPRDSIKGRLTGSDEVLAKLQEKLKEINKKQKSLPPTEPAQKITPENITTPGPLTPVQIPNTPEIKPIVQPANPTPWATSIAAPPQTVMRNMNGFTAMIGGTNIWSPSETIEKAFKTLPIQGQSIWENNDFQSQAIRQTSPQLLNRLSTQPQFELEQAPTQTQMQQIWDAISEEARKGLSPKQSDTNILERSLLMNINETLQKHTEQFEDTNNTLVKIQEQLPNVKMNQTSDSRGQMQINFGRVNVSVDGKVTIDGEEVASDGVLINTIVAKAIEALSKVDPRFRNVLPPVQQMAGEIA